MSSIHPRIKICCIANEQEAADAIAFGASAIGLVGAMPSGPGPISDEDILRIAQTVPPPIATFLLTSEQTAQGIINHHHRSRSSMRYCSTVAIRNWLSRNSAVQVGAMIGA